MININALDKILTLGSFSGKLVEVKSIFTTILVEIY